MRAAGRLLSLSKYRLSTLTHTTTVRCSVRWYVGLSPPPTYSTGTLAALIPLLGC